MEQIFREDFIWLDETFEDRNQFLNRSEKGFMNRAKSKKVLPMG